MNIYELTVKIEADFPNNADGDIQKWIEIIDPVLAATGQHRIGNDEIECLYLTKDWLHVTTGFYTRGYEGRDVINIPAYILKEEDPIREATIYCISKKLSAAKLEHSIAQNRADVYSKRVAELESELKDLN